MGSVSRLSSYEADSLGPEMQTGNMKNLFGLPTGSTKHTGGVQYNKAHWLLITVTDLLTVVIYLFACSFLVVCDSVCVCVCV